MVILEIQNLSKNFGGVHAVYNLSFKIRRGELVGLIGPNGAGKTTVFNLISGVYPPSQGSIIFQGSDITGMKTHKIIKKGIARTFQTSSLFKKYSVIENVLTAFHLRLKTGIWSSLFPNKDIIQRENNIRERAIDILRFLRIDHLRYEIADNLSFGHQKLLGIAMALVLSPKLLMFDEPVGGLSEEETKMVIDRIVKIRTQNPDIAILLVEHNMRVIMGICERIIAMNFGIKIAEGTPDEIRHNEDVIKAYLGSTDAS